MIDVVFFDESEGAVRLIPLVFDATPEEQHRASSVATDDEIETGATTTDHVRPTRRSITFDVVISDVPIASNDAVTVLESSVDLPVPGRRSRTSAAAFKNGAWEPAEFSDPTGSSIKATLLGSPDEVTRVNDSWAILEDARQRALLCIVTTRFEAYQDMVLLEMTATRTAADGSWLRASLTFRELGFQSTEIVDDPLPRRPRDRDEEDKGAQETTPELRSVTVQAIDALTELAEGL